MVSLDIQKSLGAFQDISKMAQNVLQILTCLIRHICKKTKSSYISKGLAVESAYVASVNLFLHDHRCRIQHIFRHKKAVGKVIGASCRYVSDRNLASHLGNSCNHFIQRAVTAAADDQIHLVCIFLHLFIGILRGLSCADDHLITAFIKDIYYIHQRCLDLALPCFGIKNKYQFFLQLHSSFSLPFILHIKLIHI